jgi:hypothetical protein
MMQVRILHKHSDEKEMAVHVPEFGDFSLKQQPGGTLQGTRALGSMSERVSLFYDDVPSGSPGKIHFKLRKTDLKDPDLSGSLHVTFTHSRKDGIWHFEDWEGTIGKDVAPLQWEKMLSDFLQEKNAKNWLRDEETPGQKTGMFKRFLQV